MQRIPSPLKHDAVGVSDSHAPVHVALVHVDHPVIHWLPLPVATGPYVQAHKGAAEEEAVEVERGHSAWLAVGVRQPDAPSRWLGCAAQPVLAAGAWRASGARLRPACLRMFWNHPPLCGWR